MRTFVLLIVFAVALLTPAGAADEIAAAQSTIRSQTEAIGRNDAAAAYDYAAPAIRALFPRADVFMSMVRKAYAPIYHHKRFEFGEARVSEGKVTQAVNIVDDDSVAWAAVYTVEQQPDGSLKISGCVLVKVGNDV